MRQLKKGKVTTDLSAFLTTEPCEPVKTYHPKAMPVILTEPDEVEQWMTAPTLDSLRLRRPLRDDWLIVGARGSKQDSAPS